MNQNQTGTMPIQKETKTMAHKTKNESDICGGLERGPGERGTVAKSTTVGRYAGPGGTITNENYGDSDAITLVNLGEANPDMMMRVRFERDGYKLYGGAGPQEDVPGNVSPRPGAGPDRSYRNPKGR